MIRFCIAAVAALALAACSKAPEDVTAHYAVGGGAGTVIVKAAANGDARLESGQQALVHKGGVDYMLITDSKGSVAANMTDFLAVIGELMREDGAKPQTPPAQGDFELTKTGTDTVAGIKGEIWRITPKDPTKAPAGQTSDAVINSDPAFAHVGKALSMQTRLGAAMQQLQGGSGSFDKLIQEMLDKGMVLRFDNTLKLDKLEKGPIDAKTFALPAVLDKAALKKRLTEERDRMRAAQAAAPTGQPPIAMPPGEAAPAPAPKAAAPAPRKK
ncbi:hypothetical protein FHS95_003572 [Sphingomonas naasensis]|uniref:DUF4412 domain-containing protein n=1 Tax=Sphingomonas naasensis TaxID=1344951 RepID=A0A4S1WH61_9SPHN|nr:hypothetical protein [Sphingomonas naasensis]NIJ21861.1 hypothetical protein [Sphingomonas naasensis]TGX42441.1 hypothetical protein E5A74_11420 [Sphingomonas naasensis]